MAVPDAVPHDPPRIYASRHHWQKLTTDLRKVYTAPTLDGAAARFEEFTHAWGDRYRR